MQFGNNITNNQGILCMFDVIFKTG